MKIKYMSIIDDHNNEVKRYYDQDDEDSIADEDLLDLIPDTGDQIWIPNKGLYLIERTRWLLFEDSP